MPFGAIFRRRDVCIWERGVCVDTRSQDMFFFFIRTFTDFFFYMVLFGGTPKKEGFSVHVIRTLSFFSGKK